MKKISIALGVFIVLAVIIAAILPYIIDINDIVAGQIPNIEAQLHRDIRIGHVRLTILTGLGAEISDVAVSNARDFQKKDFLSIDSLKVKVRVLPLLKKEILVSSILIDKPAVLIERNDRGVFNFSDLTGDGKSEKQPAGQPAPEAPLKSLENITVSRIALQDGGITFIDAAGGGSPREIRLEKLNLELKTVSLFQKIHVDFDTDVYADARAGHVGLTGEIGPVGNNPAPENIDMDLTLSLSDVNLSHLAAYLEGLRVNSGGVDIKTAVKGRLGDNLQCRADINWDKLDINPGNVTVDGTASPSLFINGPWRISADVSMPGADDASTGELLRFTAGLDAAQGEIAMADMFRKDSGTPLSLSTSGRLKKDTLRIEDMKFVLNRLMLTAGADIVNFADPLIDGRAAIASTPLNALAPVLPALKPFALQGTLELSDARFKGKIGALQNLKGVSAKLSIRDGSAVSSQPAMKIDKIQATLTVADEAVRISDTSARIDESDVSLNAVVRNPAKPDITFSLASSYLDVGALVPPSTATKSKPGGQKEPSQSPSPGGGPPPDMRVNGRIAIDQCKYDKLLLKNVTAELVYADAVATLKNVKVETFDGKISTTAEINVSDMTDPRWTADLTVDNISANAALSTFTDLKDAVYGNFSGNLSLQGRGTDWNVISKNLDGTGSAAVVNGKLARVNLLDAVGQSLLHFPGLGQVAQAMSPKADKNLKETPFKDLLGNLKIQGGKILLDAFSMSARDFTLSGTGDIGLDKRLDLEAALVCSKEISDRLQKDKAMKYLLNENQRLEIPCAFKGDITRPDISVDGESLRQMMGNAVKDELRKGVEDKLGQEAGRILEQLLK